MTTQPTPLSDTALNQWPDFVQSVLTRLEAGRKKYGDPSFTRAPEELAGEIEQELLDVAGWAFVLWVRLRGLHDQLEQI